MFDETFDGRFDLNFLNEYATYPTKAVVTLRIPKREMKKLIEKLRIGSQQAKLEINLHGENFLPVETSLAILFTTQSASFGSKNFEVKKQKELEGLSRLYLLYRFPV